MPSNLTKREFMEASKNSSQVNLDQPYGRVLISGSNATICNKTDKVVEAVFSYGSFYLKIDGKTLSPPGYSNPKKMRFTSYDALNVRFYGSKEFIIKKKGDFIKIIEKDDAKGSVLFLDPTKALWDKTFDVYHYKPREFLTLETVQKLAGLIREDFPNVELDHASYNRHGVVFIGNKDSQVESKPSKITFKKPSKSTFNTLFWTNPKYTKSYCISHKKSPGPNDVTQVFRSHSEIPRKASKKAHWMQVHFVLQNGQLNYRTLNRTDGKYVDLFDHVQDYINREPAVRVKGRDLFKKD